MIHKQIAKSLLCASFLLGQPILAQQDSTPTIRRPTIGVRIQWLPTTLFTTRTVNTSTTSPIADYVYSATSDSPKLTVGPTLEYRLRDRLSLGLEFRFHHAQYQQKTEIRSGQKDPNSSTDDRAVTTITETTKANYWEFPLLIHYYGLKPTGWLSRTYVSGGMEFRRVGKIRTGNEFSYADGTTDYNETPTTPVRNNQFGFVAGIGFRYVDDFHIKVTPEVRFIRWQGQTLQGTAYSSVANQIEVGLGISF